MDAIFVRRPILAEQLQVFEQRSLQQVQMFCIDVRGNQIQRRLYAGDLVDPARRSAFFTQCLELLSRLTETRFQAFEH